MPPLQDDDDLHYLGYERCCKSASSSSSWAPKPLDKCLELPSRSQSYESSFLQTVVFQLVKDPLLFFYDKLKEIALIGGHGLQTLLDCNQMWPRWNKTALTDKPMPELEFQWQPMNDLQRLPEKFLTPKNESESEAFSFQDSSFYCCHFELALSFLLTRAILIFTIWGNARGRVGWAWPRKLMMVRTHLELLCVLNWREKNGPMMTIVELKLMIIVITYCRHLHLFGMVREPLVHLQKTRTMISIFLLLLLPLF